MVRARPGRPQIDPLSATFFALADPTRRALLARLARGPASVRDLAAPFDMSGPAISKHLAVLERAGLVRQARDAQRRPRALDPRPLADAAKWASGLKATWDARFSRLDDVLAAMKKERTTR